MMSFHQLFNFTVITFYLWMLGRLLQIQLKKNIGFWLCVCGCVFLFL